MNKISGLDDQCLWLKKMNKISGLDVQFVVRSDASDSGLGVVLLQEKKPTFDDMPCRYASRRLNPRESSPSNAREKLAQTTSVTNLTDPW
ncbi:hypothetical protein PoB_005869900 [Plakobranchus ocellatus]|uniref:Reverse transcriptase/retrotransposon-derived protein RNase H-like domain-containing protein n=1 Tax=Plakobranchus ocellatus TaxID=259542 RepID=A0AAV4CHH1_9GAST|nr:hypothetical protein PoB_005869900 [Plakobranchus ocellatus]